MPRGSRTLVVHGELRHGEVIVDNTDNKWKLGKAIGIGGFGEIYDVASSTPPANSLDKNKKYVAKIEKHKNGPLFVEINCYLRLGRQQMIDQWKKEKQLRFLGLPHFVASGSHTSKNEKYRFLIMPKYEIDLEAILRIKRIFNLKTVLVIASRIIDTIEYIHSHGYVHSDVKASNIMLNRGEEPVNKRPSRTRKSVERFCPSPLKKKSKPVSKVNTHNLRRAHQTLYVDDIPYLEEVLRDFEERKHYKKEEFDIINDGEDLENKEDEHFQGDEIYLLDYGLATKYLLSNGEHREFTSDQRRAHAGTILFCSRDAHKGVASRRSDLESLAYNMIYWLTGTLPWIDDIREPEVVERKKNRAFADIKIFLNVCFEDPPRFLVELFTHLAKLNFKEAPNYQFFRHLFEKTVKDYGYKLDGKLDFDNLEGWGRKQKKTGKSKSSRKENKHLFKRPSILLYSPLRPLSSNIIFKRPKLRKKINDRLAKNSMMNWSKILVMDPETIIKQATTRKSPEDERNFSISQTDLEKLNPTPAMRDVFLKVSEREEGSPFYGSRGDGLYLVDPIDGYTAEMMKVYKLIVEQRELELELAVQQRLSCKKKKRKRLNNSASPSRRAAKTVRTSAVTSQHSLRKTTRSRPS